MANQSPDRRHALEMIALATAASRFTGFSRWICEPQHAMEESAHPGPHTPRPHKYDPQFFTPAEFATLDQCTELIIPRDETPGAKDAGVSEFIDFMAANDALIQRALRNGIHALNGAGFAAATLEQQNELLRVAAHSANPVARDFFLMLRRYTVMGYYTTRIGLQQLDYPGLKFYLSSPGCPHHGDPLHHHLPAPKA